MKIITNTSTYNKEWLPGLRIFVMAALLFMNFNAKAQLIIKTESSLKDFDPGRYVRETLDFYIEERNKAATIVMEDYEKFEQLRINDGINEKNVNLAEKYIVRCLDLSIRFNLNIIGIGELFYLTSLVKHVQGETYYEYLTLKLSVKEGYSKANQPFNSVFMKVREEEFNPYYNSVIRSFNAYDADSISGLMPSAVMTNINSCININEKYYGDLCSRGDLYLLKSKAYKAVYNDEANALNFLMMAANKGDSEALHQKSLLAQKPGYDYGMWNNNTSSAAYTIDIYNPKVRWAKTTNVKIMRVYVNGDKTIVECSCTNQNEDKDEAWYNISANTYIEAKGVCYKIIGARGIPFSPDKYQFDKVGETGHFFLIFPAIPATIKKIDLIESETSSWQFYGIKLKAKK